MGSAVPRRVVVATLPILFGVWLASVAEVARTCRVQPRARVLMLLPLDNVTVFSLSSPAGELQHSRPRLRPSLKSLLCRAKCRHPVKPRRRCRRRCAVPSNQYHCHRYVFVPSLSSSTNHTVQRSPQSGSLYPVHCCLLHPSLPRLLPTKTPLNWLGCCSSAAAPTSCTTTLPLPS